MAFCELFSSKIMVNRCSPENKNAFMITKDIIGCINPNAYYLIKKDNLIEINDPSKNKIVSENNENNIGLEKTIISGEWIKESTINCNQKRNILGNDGIFVSNTDSIILKKQLATTSNLKYYGAKLLKINDNLSFETNDILPVATVDVGEDYIKDYIMDEQLGGGVYLEYHNNPHFHMPLNNDSRGCLILGKKEDDNYTLSAFQIPHGYGIYTPPWGIHNDCFLIGEYLVVYSVSEDYSTVIIKNKNQTLVEFCLK